MTGLALLRALHQSLSRWNCDINNDTTKLDNLDNKRDYRIAGKFGNLTLFEHLAKKVWQINRSTNRLLIVSTNLDSFSLANHGGFAKFSPTKLSHYMVFETYVLLSCGNYLCLYPSHVAL